MFFSIQNPFVNFWKQLLFIVHPFRNVIDLMTTDIHRPFPNVEMAKTVDQDSTESSSKNGESTGGGDLTLQYHEDISIVQANKPIDEPIGDGGKTEGKMHSELPLTVGRSLSLPQKPLICNGEEVATKAISENQVSIYLPASDETESLKEGFESSFSKR